MAYLNTNSAVSGRPMPIQPFLTEAPNLARVRELRIENTREVIDFLKKRPVHTVVMTSFIIDNGIESTLNRGKFYGYRNAEGTLEGVALIGHTTIVEARSDKALKALAFIARSSETPINLIMSDGEDALRFWTFFADGPRCPRLTCTELLFEVGFPFLVQDCEWEIRNAGVEDLHQVAEAQAEVALIESGVDPMERDREGFLKRVARRIEQKRVFVVMENGKLVFKADIIAETPEVIYLEGVYVSEEYRGRNVGSGCLAKLSLDLLNRSQNICLLSNISFDGVHKTFLKAGYKHTGQCTTLFV
jgi:GNAT superfamily N-acetyltransferase